MPAPVMLLRNVLTPVRLGDVMSPRDNSFGVLRLMMALAVLVSHSYLFRYGTSTAEPLHHWTGHSLGEHAVQVFFILSGILVAQSLDRSADMLDFVRGRVLRIFPGLVVCVALTAFLLGPWLSTLAPSDYFAGRELWAYLARTLSLSTGSAPLPGLYNDLPLAGLVNMSLWTLKYEVLCYAGLALLGLAGLFKPRWRNRLTVLLAVGLCVVFIDRPKAIETYTSLDNVRYFALFFGTGVLAYLLRQRILVHPLALIPLLGLFVLGIGTRFGELASAAFLGYATLAVAVLPLGPLRRLTNEYDLSFGVYIYAGPIQQALLLTDPGRSPLTVTAMALVIVLPLAFLSWTLVEKPALALRKSVRRKSEALRPRHRILPAELVAVDAARAAAGGPFGLAPLQPAKASSVRREPRFGHRRRAR